MGSAVTVVLAVIVGGAAFGECRREEPSGDAKEGSAAPAAAASDLAIEIGALLGFRGESHDVIALPDGECIVALSWFGRTDFGAGEMHVDAGGRQSYLVRYGKDGKVRWSTQVPLWPADLAFDGAHTVMVVGETREGKTHAVVDVDSGAIARSGSIEGYPKAMTFVDGHPLVLSTTKDTHEAVIEDVSSEPVRWPWRAKGGIPLAMAASFGGGVIVTMSEVDSGGQTTVFAIDRTGKELWRRSLCEADYSAPIVVDADGSSTVVACDPAKIVRLGADGAVRGEIALGGNVRAERIAQMDARLVIGGQLLGELTVGTRTFASWDNVEGDEKSGHGDALVVVHDGTSVVGVAHGHGVEVDAVTSIAVTGNAIWMVGATRYSLDFGGAKRVASDPDGAGVGFVARATVK